MSETHDPAGPGPRDEIRNTEAYRLGRAVALLRALLDDDRDTDRAMAREFLDEEEERSRAAHERFKEWKRTLRPDGPRAAAPVEVLAERYDHPTHPHTHSSDYDADTCDICFPEEDQ